MRLGHGGDCVNELTGNLLVSVLAAVFLYCLGSLWRGTQSGFVLAFVHNIAGNLRGPDKGCPQRN